MAQILCSTGALIGRPNNRDYRILRDVCHKLNCDGFEFMMYSTWYGLEGDILKFLLELNINIPVMHCEKHMGEYISKGSKEDLAEAVRRFEINCKMAKALSVHKMVVHLWDGVTSDSNFSNNLETYGILRKIAEAYEIDLLIENVVCNHENPMKHWMELLNRYPDIHFIYDTKMAAFHCQENLLYDDKYDILWKEKHIRHYHVNDYGGGYMEWSRLKTLPSGKGHFDFYKFFDYIRKTGYNDTFTVEATAFGNDGKIDINMLNKCFEKIRRYIG